jgi:uncharacterized protein (DUF1684 family)
MSDWAESVREYRRRREEYLREDPHSPVPEAEREAFRLRHYPPDPAYRFVVPLHEHDPPETVAVKTSTGQEREYLRWGEFRVDLGGDRVAIQAYRSDPDADRLWVPFRDATSGEETYGAGRYLDLEAEHHRTEEGWVLDFNRAYNPTCAYAESYDCPLPPTDNWLDVPVEAGEKLPE